MKKTKVFLSIMICISCIFFSGITAYANENVGVTENPDYLSEIIENPFIQTYGPDEPSKGWNLNTKGKYSFSGNAKNTNLYTNYYFTGASTVEIYVKNSGSRLLTVELKQKQLINLPIHYVDVSSGESTTYKVNSLDSSKRYFIFFKNPSGSFNGYIKRVN